MLDHGIIVQAGLFDSRSNTSSRSSVTTDTEDEECSVEQQEGTSEVSESETQEGEQKRILVERI